ncbi:MAG: ABC transporter permease subunit [Deltaproteobacteria bacterium]|nr:ABC transporter permease subunit [Deltaproteobacteria bacterium]
MSFFSAEVRAVARLDLADALRSRWMLFSTFLYAVLGATFVLVGMRESTVVGFSGIGRVLLSMIHALLLILPLLALTATSQVVNRARDDGTLELIFSQPVRRTAYFLAVTVTRFLMLVVPLVVVMVSMAAIAAAVFDEAVSWSFLFQSIGVCAALITAYVGIGMAVSTFVRSQARSVIWTLTIFALGAAFLDFGLIGLMLRWQLNAPTIFLLASLNPVQAARMALLVGASTELSVLGPVGFFLAHRLGPILLFGLGIAWPAMLGLGAWLWARSTFARADIV